MVNKISNVMLEIQATKNIVIFPIASSLKNVTRHHQMKKRKDSRIKSSIKKTNSITKCGCNSLIPIH